MLGVVSVPQPGASSGVHFIDWLIVGGYFAFVIWLGTRFGKKQTSSKRYFLGNRNFPGWAVDMSIFATIISSWAFLAIPGKSFKTDMQYLLTISPIPLIVLIAVFFVIPLFRNKIQMSAYEYLERRFGLAARFYGNTVFILSHFFKMGMVLFLLCLAIEGATGWGEQYLIYIIIVVGITTITYTFFGGIEGVIWTDVIQGFLLLGGGLVGLLFLLFAHKAGPAEVLNVAWDAGKFKLATFDFDWRNISIYMLVALGFTHYLAKYTTDQTVIQRYLLAPSTKQASRSLWISVAFLGFVWVIFMIVGALLWSYYNIHSDLLPPGVRAKPDQVFAYFIGHQLPVGVVGLILAGLFAASMSTLSSDLNSLSCVLVDDFYNKIAKSDSDAKRLLFSRISVIVSGLAAIVLAIAMRKVKSMVDAFFIFNAILTGTGMIAVFFLGFLTRRCSRKGLYVALIVDIVFVAWAVPTNYKYMDPEKLAWLPKFGINLMWLGMIGTVIVFVIGYLASLILSPGYIAEEGLTIYKPKDVKTAKAPGNG